MLRKLHFGQMDTQFAIMCRMVADPQVPVVVREADDLTVESGLREVFDGYGQLEEFLEFPG